MEVTGKDGTVSGMEDSFRIFKEQFVALEERLRVRKYLSENNILAHIIRLESFGLYGLNV